MYEPFFGLDSSPFGLTPNPRFLFRSKVHHEILSLLLYGVTTSKGVMLLLGEVGTGKTTLCRALLRELPAEAESVLVLNRAGRRDPGRPRPRAAWIDSGRVDDGAQPASLGRGW